MTTTAVKNFRGIPIVALPPDVSRILFVSNLDASVTGEVLYKVFRKYGPLRQVRVGNTTETSNTAYVIFESVFDALHAQEHLDGFGIGGAGKAKKKLSVRFWDEKKHRDLAEKKRKRREQQETLARRQREMQQPKAAANAAGDAADAEMPRPTNSAAAAAAGAAQS